MMKQANYSPQFEISVTAYQVIANEAGLPILYFEVMAALKIILYMIFFFLCT
jgi:hypothetical protein